MKKERNGAVMLKALRWLIAIILVVGVIVLLAPTPSLLVSIWVWAAAINIAYILIRSSIIVTPTVHADVVLFFKRPLRKPFQRFKRKKGDKDKKDEWWVLENGIHFIWPFVCSVRRVSLELAHTPIAETFFSDDKLEVRVRGSVQWFPDSNHLADVFITRSEAAITKGLVDAVHAELGRIAGLKKAVAYIQGREAVELLINEALRLDPMSYPFPEKTGAERFDCCMAEPDKKRLLRDALKVETDKPHELSVLEKLYGIDVARFALADVDYEEETRKALQLGRQTEEKVKAYRVRAASTLRVANALKRLAVEGQEALNASQVIHEDAEKQVQTIEGLRGGGALPLVHIFTSGQTGKPPDEVKKIIKP